MGQTSPENLRTTSAELIFWLQIHGPSWCMNGLAAPLELYCVERVKATQQSGRRIYVQQREDLEYGISCSGNHRHEERLGQTKNGPRMTTLGYFVSFSCTISYR